MKILTISIAAYNVEKYLENTLDSICNSDVLDDVEVIVVDDGSKDKTGEIGARYAEKYPNSIRSISKANGGHGSTINVGLAEATGKYFRILDGDDWFDSNGFKRFISKLKDIDTDLVISDKKLAYPDHEEIVGFDYLRENQEYTISNKHPYDICTLSTMTVKTNVLKQNGIKITENSFYVDLEFVVHCMLLSNTFSYIHENVYMYRRGIDEQSVSKKSMLRNVDMLSRITEGLFSIVENSETSIQSREFSYERIKHATGALYRTYFLMEKSNDSKSNILAFESVLNTKHPEGFRKIGEDSFIKGIRLLDYSFLPLIRKAYRMKCKREGLF